MDYETEKAAKVHKGCTAMDRETDRLEASLYPEGPATGQLDKGFPWSTSILSWQPITRCVVSLAALPMSDQLSL
jgi:hypothetical protein